MILKKFLGNSLKKVTTVGESGEIPHFCYLGGPSASKFILLNININLYQYFIYENCIFVCRFEKKLFHLKLVYVDRGDINLINSSFLFSTGVW